MKLCIGTASHSGQVQVKFAKAVIDTVKALTAVGVEVQWRVISHASFIHLARERLARDFLASDYSHLLFADDDIGWDLDGLLKMIEAGVDCVGAICPKRRDPLEWVVNVLRRPDGSRIEENGLIECAYVGTGLLLLTRAALETVGAPYFDIAREAGGPIGEDAWFCRELRRKGGRVWACPNVTITHTGPKSWTGNFHLKET